MAGIFASFGEVNSADGNDPYLVVLGIAQDGGVPQAGTKPSRANRADEFKRLATSLAVIDPRESSRWLFDCTPDFREQLDALDRMAPHPDVPGISGIFLTHAHMGHYTGLLFLGHESMGSTGVPVFAMPRMGDFLSTNGPWDQLVRYKNIEVRQLSEQSPVELGLDLTVTPFLVPHRQEYSEVVGYRIDGPNKRVLFIPDIDKWEDLDGSGNRIEDLVASVDIAYLDGTFFGNGEIPGRDMSTFPHPFIQHSLKRFSSLPASERKKIRFIHLNHTNPALRTDSDQYHTIVENGFGVARENERIDL